MEAAPQPGPFAIEMERRREELGLSKRRAAQRCDISPALWSRITKGYESRGGIPVATGKPGKDTVVRIARGLNWPRSEALALAGYDPDLIPDDPVDLPPNRIFDIWPQLSHQQKQAVEWVARLMVDPDAAIDSTPPRMDHHPAFTDAPDIQPPTAPAAGTPRVTKTQRR
jgi:transcriptional regulator with XRE-family HTH domain